MLGQEEAITALAAICARHAAGKVRSPGGLMRRMVELHQVCKSAVGSDADQRHKALNIHISSGPGIFAD